MDSASGILAQFDAEMRVDPPLEPGVRHEHAAGGVVRTVGTRWAVVCAPVTAADADRVIAEQLAYFRSPGASVLTRAVVAEDPRGAWPPPDGIEWKVYGHDPLPDLGARLAAAGFALDEEATLMSFDLAAGRPGPAPAAAGIDIRRVADADGVADLVAVGTAAFGGRDTAAAARDARLKRYALRLSDPAMGLYVAYAGNRPVSAGRIDFAPGRSFAGLWGGGTIPEYRGRGIYRAIVLARAEEARRRGYRYMTVEARDTTSRPILERLGFVPLTTVTEWKYRLEV